MLFLLDPLHVEDCSIASWIDKSEKIGLSEGLLMASKRWKINLITAMSAVAPISAMLLTGLAPWSVAASPPGHLTPEQRRSLKTLGIQIAVPGYVPSGFTVASITKEPCPANTYSDWSLSFWPNLPNFISQYTTYLFCCQCCWGWFRWA